ncbi:hypothetical protein TNCV_4479251 [Trichonephila clavipes]|nr:hypothetical protein TNCV_4479251 [Trichonephila clavipes]
MTRALKFRPRVCDHDHLGSVDTHQCEDLKPRQRFNRHQLLYMLHEAFGDGPLYFEPTPELESPLLTTAPHQREDARFIDRFNVHLSPTRWVFSGTGLELVTSQTRYDTLTTRLPQPHQDSKLRLHIAGYEFVTMTSRLQRSLKSNWTNII